MKVKSIMNHDVASCRPEDGLHAAAQIMWDHDCGVVPVVDTAGRLAGMVTDRDLCMAALLANRPPEQITVGEVMARAVCTCGEDDDLRAVHSAMREKQVRRLPVVDDEGHLAGLVSLNDLTLEAFGSRSSAAARRQRDVARTLAAISSHRNGVGEEE